MRRIIDYWLTQNPPVASSLDTLHLVLDGSFIEKRVDTVFVIMNGSTHTLVSGKYRLPESMKPLTQYFSNLKLEGLIPESATIDGNTSLFKAVIATWPKVKVQRCVVHVQRQGLEWCRRRPKRTDARKLRNLFLEVTEIHNQQQCLDFLSRLQTWEDRYGKTLALLPQKGWVTTDLQRARSMILNALPYLFTYLDNPHVPKTTNCLEGYFSRMKLRYRQHRGLSKEKRTNYFAWYFHLVRR